MPSRLGLTPAGKQPEQYIMPALAAAAGQAPASAAGVGGNLKSILKRLNFSNTKGRAAAVAAAADASAAALPTGHSEPAGVAVESTIKQLRFDGATPAASTALQPAAAGRHVSFDASTVSPAAGVRPVRLPGAAGTPTWRTPQPTIEEEDSAGSSGSEESGTPVAGSVNSAAAGHTPYDRRLSSLIRKYQVAGTPELPDAELDELTGARLLSCGESPGPLWRRGSLGTAPLTFLTHTCHEPAVSWRIDPSQPAVLRLDCHWPPSAAQTPHALPPGTACPPPRCQSPSASWPRSTTPAPGPALHPLLQQQQRCRQPTMAATPALPRRQAAMGAAPRWAPRRTMCWTAS